MNFKKNLPWFHLFCQCYDDFIQCKVQAKNTIQSLPFPLIFILNGYQKTFYFTRKQNVRKVTSDNLDFIVFSNDSNSSVHLLTQNLELNILLHVILYIIS